MKPKILVTGGLGYIGSHTVVELIFAGYDPVIIDNLSNSEAFILDRIFSITNYKPRFYQGDCNDNFFLNEVFTTEQSIIGVIHFAGYKSVGESMRDPLKYYINNVGSTTNLLEVMHKYNVKLFVFSSSATVYGSPMRNPIVETEFIKEASSPYGSTKIVCENILKEVCQALPTLQVVSLRYFNPIGAHNSGLIGELPKGKPNNLVPYLTQAVAGLVDDLQVFGIDYPTADGSCVRDYIHVSDLALAHIAALQYLMTKTEGLYEVFNVGTGSGTSVFELITRFETVNSVKVPYTVGPRRAGDVPSCFANVDKINTTMGWASKKTLDESLQDVWRWQKTLIDINPIL